MNHKNILPYDPGMIPTKSALEIGDQLEIIERGYPPFKDTSKSIRNITHRYHDRFVKLRDEAINVMAGRAWSHRAIEMDIELHAPLFEINKTAIDYAGGIADSLGGSSGYTFTYLPIVYEDDCQICKSSFHLVKDKNIWYKIKIKVLN